MKLKATNNVCSCNLAGKKFADCLQEMPMPGRTLRETYQRFGTALHSDRIFKTVCTGVKGLHETALQSLNDLPKARNNHVARSCQKIVFNDFAAAEEEGYGNQEHGHHKASIEHQAFINGEQWLVSHHHHCTEDEESYCCYLLQMEKALAWPEFRLEFDKRAGTNSHVKKNDELRALNAKFREQRQKIRIVEVGLFEEEDLAIEVHEPAKMILLLKEYSRRRERILQRQYDDLYEWWNENLENVQAVASRMDCLLSKIESANSVPFNSIRSLALLAGVQATLWNMLWHLTIVAQALVRHAQAAEAAKQQTAATISMYRIYKTLDH